MSPPAPSLLPPKTIEGGASWNWCLLLLRLSVPMLSTISWKLQVYVLKTTLKFGNLSIALIKTSEIWQVLSNSVIFTLTSLKSWQILRILQHLRRQNSQNSYIEIIAFSHLQIVGTPLCGMWNTPVSRGMSFEARGRAASTRHPTSQPPRIHLSAGWASNFESTFCIRIFGTSTSTTSNPTCSSSFNFNQVELSRKIP